MTGSPLSAIEIGTETTEEEIETEIWEATEIETWVVTEGEVRTMAGGAATVANPVMDLLLREDLTIVQGHLLKILGERSKIVNSIILENLVFYSLFADLACVIWSN